MFASMLVYIAIQYAVSESDLPLMSGAFVCGLSLCNQHTMVLFEVPLVSWIIYCETQAGTLSLSKLVKSGSLFLAGLLPYAYLPYASSHKKQGSWGDSSTLQGFVHHLRRGDYGTFRLFSSDKVEAGMLHRIGLYIYDILTRQGLYGCILILAVIGIWNFKANKKSTFRHRTLVMSLFCTWLFYVIIFHYLSNMPLSQRLLFGVQARFWMQPNILVFIFSGVGLGKCMVNRKRILCFITCSVMVCSQIMLNFNISDQSANDYLELYARAIVAPIPPNSMLLIAYDQQWTSLRYLQQCKQFRPDITIVNAHMMTYTWFASYVDLYNNDENKCMKLPGSNWAMKNSANHKNGAFSSSDLIQFNFDKCKGGVYFTGALPYSKVETVEDTFAIVNHGLVKQLIPRKTNDNTDGVLIIGFDKWLERITVALDNIALAMPVTSMPLLSKYDDETWEWTIVRDYVDNLSVIASVILQYSIEEDHVNTILFAAFLYEVLEQSFPGFLNAADYKNLGLAYVKVIQSKSNSIQAKPQLRHNGHINVLFNQTATINSIKEAIAPRVVKYWSHFLSMDDAKLDSGFKNILSIVNHLKNIQTK